MQMLFKITVLITLSLLGGLFYSITANILVLTDLIPVEDVSTSFGYEMTKKTVIVWSVCVGLGIISLFIKQKWRYILLLCPLIIPSVFAVLYSLSQQ